jgi:hypothetical protein
MQALILFTMFSVLSFKYLASLGLLPGASVYSFEVLALIVAATVVALGAVGRFRFTPPAYWVVFAGLLIVMICGFIVNSVEPGPIFAGFRNYLRALPFFFLPAVLLIPKRHVKVQLLLLLAFCVLQLPLAYEQRMATIARGGVTGDETFGTLMQAKGMSMFLISGACVLSGFFLRGRVPAKVYFPLLFVLLLPTMLNETKGSLFLAPLGLITVYLVTAKPGARLKHSVLGVGVAAAFLAVFIPVYDHFMSARWDYGIVDFFFMEGRVEYYLDRDLEVGDYTDQGGGAGKVGGLRVAVRTIMSDPVHMAFGYGAGNVSDSALGPQFDGEYFRRYQIFLRTSLSIIVFELGLLGAALLLLLYYLIFRDTVAVSRRDEGFMGALAAGWSGVVPVMLVGIAYHFPTENVALSMLFWYFSGLMVASRVRLALEDEGAREVSDHRISVPPDPDPNPDPRHAPAAGLPQFNGGFPATRRR